MKYFFNENDIFLHVRRGDYVELSDIHYLQPISYFYECIEQINNGISRIFVVSDDIRWIKENRVFNDEIFVHVEKLDELENPFEERLKDKIEIMTTKKSRAFHW